MTAIALDNPKIEQDIPLDRIHPDPFQPRLEPDADLAASIISQGVLQAISVEVIDASNAADRICPDCGKLFVDLEAEGGHFMLQDGERRYRGSVAAGRKTVLAKVVPAVTEGERLVRQLTANTGKPLTPVEEAFAFKRLIDENGCTQVELARILGRPRSVVGDRIRLVELDKAWLDAITAGKLQVSHAAILSTFSPVPAEYQAKAAKNFFEDYRTKRFLEGGGSVPVGEMPRLLFVAFRDYIKETSKTPGYRGPTIEIKDQYSSHKSKYAADITLWRPCFRAYEKQARHTGLIRREDRRLTGTYLSAPEKAVKALKAAGFDPPLRAVGNTRVLPEKGEFVIVTEQGFANDLHPKVLLDKIDPSTITYVKGNFGGDELFTSDAAAVSAAREAYRQHVANIAEKELAPLRKQLTPELLDEFAVQGPGTIDLVSLLNPERGTPKVLALALGLTIAGGITDGDSLDEEEGDGIFPSPDERDASRLLSALAAVRANGIKVPDDWQIGQLIRKGISDVAFKVEKAQGKKVSRAQKSQNDLNDRISAEATADVATSKKQQKREARAAGKQVGDPSRAHDDNLHGLLDAQSVDEEELVEA